MGVRHDAQLRTHNSLCYSLLVVTSIHRGKKYVADDEATGIFSFATLPVRSFFLSNLDATWQNGAKKGE